ncbi:MAG: hypothetical protein ACD_39C00821G0003 [uncultured bacterium]|nr:MAG: hypothetical protein ACD_39C00821G0003 [uncultured bacterium]
MSENGFPAKFPGPFCFFRVNRIKSFVSYEHVFTARFYIFKTESTVKIRSKQRTFQLFTIRAGHTRSCYSLLIVEICQRTSSEFIERHEHANIAILTPGCQVGSIDRHVGWLEPGQRNRFCLIHCQHGQTG